MLHVLHDFFFVRPPPRRTPEFTCCICYATFSLAIQPPPDPRFYMLQMLRRYATFRMLTVPRHSPRFYTCCTIFFRLPSSPRRTPDFTCYMCYATFACSRSLGTAPHSTCYICYLAFFDSSTPGREPPHSTCYLCYLPFFDCPGRSPHFCYLCYLPFSISSTGPSVHALPALPGVLGSRTPWSMLLMPACHVARVASKST